MGGSDTPWSLEDYCASLPGPVDTSEWSAEGQAWWNALDLPSHSPFCHQYNDSTFWNEGVPPMGPLDPHDGSIASFSILEKGINLWFMVAPPLLAMAELWLRLFAAAVGPLGIVYLLWILLVTLKADTTRTRTRTTTSTSTSTSTTPNKKSPSSRSSPRRASSSGGKPLPTIRYSLVCLLTVASSLVLMTDTLYVLDNGPIYGAVLFVLSVLVALATTLQFQLTKTSVCLWGLVLLATSLVWTPSRSVPWTFGDPIDQVGRTIDEGLYYDSTNEFTQTLVDHWPATDRTYSKALGATPWMPTGDSRTGLPFLVNHWPKPSWRRVYLPVMDNENEQEQEQGQIHGELNQEEKEYVALDIAMPMTEHGQVTYDASKPLYLILHGLNGGSDEEYIRDFTARRLPEGSTVVVMVARGLMDLPIRGWNLFHGARTTDAHAAALALRRTLGAVSDSHSQVLIGVGYSMGAIVLNNYVASYGGDCALDGAMGISGGLDMRHQEHFVRAQRLWQPVLAGNLRSEFLLGKWGHRVQARLSHFELLKMLRASHITEIDRYAVVVYNGFNDLDDYYSSMSALGDVPIDPETGLYQEHHTANGKIQSVAIPFCVLHALDDPLITWRTTVQNEGWMHPTSLSQTGSGNLMILLTKAGGHVGWPLGMLPFIDKWRWMSNVASSFGNAVAAAKASNKKSTVQGSDEQEGAQDTEPLQTEASTTATTTARIEKGYAATNNKDSEEL